jgi:hypothetical protein
MPCHAVAWPLGAGRSSLCSAAGAQPAAQSALSGGLRCSRGMPVCQVAWGVPVW